MIPELCAVSLSLSHNCLLFHPFYITSRILYVIQPASFIITDCVLTAARDSLVKLYICPSILDCKSKLSAFTVPKNYYGTKLYICIQLWYSEEACSLNCDGLTYLLFSEIFLQLFSDTYGPF